MQALRINAPFAAKLISVSPPARSSGQALLRICAAGVCGSDLQIYRGTHPFVIYPRVIGHELAAQIIEIDRNHRHLQVGDHVVVEPYLNCGRCHMCAAGRYNACLNIRVMGIHHDGGMTEQILAPIDKLHKPPRPIPDEQLALVETLGIGAQAVKRAQVGGRDFVAVLGAGAIGIGAMLMAKCAGARTAIIDLDQTRLRRAAQMGVDVALDASEPDTADRLREAADGLGPHVVVEAAGVPETVGDAIQYVRPGGRIAVIGISNKPMGFSHAPLVAKELDVFGSRNSADQFDEVLAAVGDGRINLTPMITHRVELSELPELLAEMDRTPLAFGKVIVTWPF